MKSLTIVMKTFLTSALLFSCTSSSDTSDAEATTKAPYQLMIVDPGHFHAGLVHKMPLEDVDTTVHVYAPKGPDVEDHLKRVESYNTREEDPTNWNQVVYTGPDFFEKMIEEKPGNIMVVAGNNAKKTEYIKRAVEAGINVLADKPMVINSQDFNMLKETFDIAKDKNVLLYDIMTERHEITIMIQRELSQIPALFGELEKGSVDNPAITKESVHHFYKFVSGAPLKRPAWFFDVTQQGEGMVDIMTHLVDMIQWECYPEQIIDYENDIEVLNAKRWATELTPSMFKRVTYLDDYPSYLNKDIVNDSILNVYSNGEINYTLKGTHAKTSVIWNYEAPEGAKDTHYSIMRGTKANLIIRQGEKENYVATLYVEKSGSQSAEEFQSDLDAAISALQAKYQGLAVVADGSEFRVDIPDRLKVGHEAHFTQVAKKYLTYLKEGKMPDWEIPNMLAKYYTTTKGYEVSR